MSLERYNSNYNKTIPRMIIADYLLIDKPLKSCHCHLIDYYTACIIDIVNLKSDIQIWQYL